MISPKYRIFLIFSLFLLVVGTVRIAPPDLAYYYSVTHSLLYDLDFCFANEYEHFPFAIHELYKTQEGYPANDWPIGTGIAWLPFLALAGCINFLASLFASSEIANAFSWFSKWVITFGATLLYSGGTAYLSFRLCIREQCSKNVALWATALVSAGSSFTYHLYVNSADSHPPSAFFIVLFLLLWLEFCEKKQFAALFLAGCALGMAALIRPHNALFLITPLLDQFIRKNRRLSWQEFFTAILTMFLTLMAVYLPQMMLWRELYGSWFAVPRSEEVHWLQPHLWQMLFSDFHGMISWSPLFGLGLLGLFINKRWWPYAIPVALQIYIYSCNVAWWAGGSFGNRRMVGCTALFVLGLAGLFQRMPSLFLKFVCILFGLWTYLLLVAEVGGAIQLDHYQSWPQIIAAIPNGFVPGIVNHFTLPQWGEHTFERIVGFVSVLLLFSLCIAIQNKTAFFTYRNTAITTLVVLVVFNIISGIAMYRSEKALAEADVSGYSNRDRFAWVIYYEKGFYLLQNRDFDNAMPILLAATLAEPRHPQPWMYMAFVSNHYGWDQHTYHLCSQAFRFGQTRDFFLDFFEDHLTKMLFDTEKNSALYYNQRGIVRTYQQKWQQARSDFEMALTLNPGWETAQTNLENLKSYQQGNRAPLWWE